MNPSNALFEDRRVDPEVRGSAEEAHLVARRRDRHVDAERPEEAPGPEAGHPV